VSGSGLPDAPLGSCSWDIAAEKENPMPSIQAVLKAEIQRLARKRIRATVHDIG